MISGADFALFIGAHGLFLGALAFRSILGRLTGV